MSAPRPSGPVRCAARFTRVTLPGRVVTLVLALLMIATAMPTPSGAAQEAAGTPVPATPVAATGDAAASPEQQLIEKYAPIAALKDQTSLCDTDGEPYLPVAVDAVLGDGTVVLKQASTGSSTTDPVLKTAPTAQDLFAQGDKVYLDLPGDPRRAGCTYAQWFAERRDSLTPTTYAHIVATGTDRLALQYWFFYVYNDFNNKHESDWEMMQIVFDVGTVEAALSAEPVEVALAQHGGGETADWTSSKLQRDGTHPIVYVAAGSHASQYGNAVWLGWGENGTGFGCDITTAPSHLVPLTPVLLPNDTPAPDSEFAWLTFTGRWGERQSGEFNGPTGPNTKRSWSSPFLWQDGLRDSSIEVPAADTFGPAPTSVFCSLSERGSMLFTRLGDNVYALAGAAIGILAVIAGLLRYSWGLFAQALALYRQRWRTFMVIGLALIPIGLLFNGFQYLLGHYPPGSLVLSVMNRSPGSYFAMAMLVGILQHLVGLIVVGPAVIEVYDEMEHRRSLGAIDAYRRMIDRFPSLVRPVLRATAIIVGLSLIVVGIPFAIRNLVRWLFIPQAVMLDNQHGSAARDASARSVDGAWLPTALKALMLSIIGAGPGVLVGLMLLVFGSASVQATNVASSLIYAAVLPFSILGLTVLYRERQGCPIAPVTPPDPAPLTDPLAPATPPASA